MYSNELKVPGGIPEPQGYRILVAVPDVMEKTKGGILLPDELKSLEKTASIFGLVVAMGPDCYKDKEKFPSGPWCQMHDYVIFRSYSGTRFKIEGQEFRIINDDTVEAVAEDPRVIARA
jgi:co-chaperonin GroES (HSP10)